MTEKYNCNNNYLDGVKSLEELQSRLRATLISIRSEIEEIEKTTLVKEKEQLLRLQAKEELIYQILLIG